MQGVDLASSIAACSVGSLVLCFLVALASYHDKKLRTFCSSWLLNYHAVVQAESEISVVLNVVSMWQCCKVVRIIELV